MGVLHAKGGRAVSIPAAPEVVRPTVCFFAPVPPPWHGSAYAVQLLLESRFAREVPTSHINTVYATDIADLGKAEWHKLSQLIRYLAALLRRCRRDGVDFVVLTPAFTFLPFLKDSVAILVVAACSRARIILWSHSNDVVPLYQSRGRLFRAYMRFVLRRATHVVTVGDLLRRNFTSFLPAERVTAIPNGLPLLDAQHAPRVGRSGSRLEVVYLSNMIKAKGWLVLLAAAKRLCAQRDDIAFTFYGAPSGDSPAAEIEREFAHAGFGDRIRYAGPVFGGGKVEALAGADVFCLPTAYPTEALPISILEAMQFGLAVVATPIGAIAEAIVPRVGGVLVEPTSVDDLVRALAGLADDRDAARRMGLANRERFRERFAIEPIVGQWVDLVTRLKMRRDEC